jgi:hypothetical protein
MTKLIGCFIIAMAVVLTASSTQKVRTPTYTAFGNGVINNAAVPGQVYVIADMPNGNIIPVIAGTTTDDYAAIANPTQLGVPNDENFYFDNFFSGAEWGVTPSANKDSWMTKGISTHTNGPDPRKPTRNPMNVRVLIVRIK